MSEEAGNVLLGVNVDHVATLRNARGGKYPDPFDVAWLAVRSGADIITFHLREDRRHIRDDDVSHLRNGMPSVLNFEAACNEEMLKIILKTKPEHVCLVPERRKEVTTEGGLDVAREQSLVDEICSVLIDAGIRISLFIDAQNQQIDAACRAGAHCVEFHTGPYSNAAGSLRQLHLENLQQAAKYASRMGLRVHAGHGLNLKNTAQIAAIAEVKELHIGHALIGRAISVGIAQAIAEFKDEIQKGRNTLKETQT